MSPGNSVGGRAPLSGKAEKGRKSCRFPGPFDHPGPEEGKRTGGSLRKTDGEALAEQSNPFGIPNQKSGQEHLKTAKSY